MRSTRVRAAVGLTAAITMLTASVAVADDLVADGDLVSSSSTALDFGTVCVGDTVTRSVAVTVDRQGNGQVYANNANVQLSGTAPSGVIAGTSSIQLPSDWVTGDQNVDNAKSRAGALAVTLDTSAPRTVSGTLALSGAGSRHGGGTLTRNTSVGVSGTVRDCAPADTTPPTITPAVSGTLGDNGWYTSDVTVTWGVVDGESDVTSSPCVPVSITADQDDTTHTCSATSAGGTASESVIIRRDATAPTITGSRTPAANTNGWNNTDVAVAFDCGDTLSGVVTCGPDETVSGEGADQSVSGTAVDAAGNTAGTRVDGISIDRTAPTLALTGGPADGATYYPHQWGSLVAPTCDASDALSGLAGDCSVGGFSTNLGTHSVTASATDRADNTATTTGASYTVANYTTRGFFAPVDLGANVWNTVKGGSTVPLKFEVFAGEAEMTATTVVTGLSAKRVVCTTGNVIEDAIEVLATGGTALRYDSTAGQFVYNWQTAKAAGSCYVVTVILDGGTTISANFKLK